MSPLCRTSLLELRTFSCVEWTWSSWKTANLPFPINTNALCCLDFVGFFSLWGNKGRICGDLSLGYPLLAMPAPAASNLRPIQKHFSELEIQSMTFPNNALVTVGKIKWVQKNKAEDQWMKGFITATIWRLNKSTQNPPRGCGFPMHDSAFAQQVSLFITFAVESQPHSHFLSWLTDGKREQASTPVELKGKTDLQFAGDNPSCGKPRVESNLLDAEVRGALSLSLTHGRP